MDARWSTLLEELRDLHRTVPEVGDFCPFPDPVTPQEVPLRHDPLCDAMRGDARLDDTAYPALRDACLAAAEAAQWRETYKDTPNGDFLHRHFGTFEMLGRDTPLGADGMRSFLVYQAPGFHYPLHHHPAEELYLVIAGEGEFVLEGAPSRTLRSGGTAYHPSNAPHALTTHDQPVLAYVLWRGDLMTKPVFTYPEAME